MQNKNTQNVTQQNIHVSKKTPSRNAKIQKLMAKHIFRFFEKRKGGRREKVDTLGLIKIN